jgi:hypothetical protein
MNWIKNDDKRVNLDNIVYFERFDFKRRDEGSDNAKAIFSIKFVYCSQGSVNLEFFSHEERESFMEKLDQTLFNQML